MIRPRSALDVWLAITVTIPLLAPVGTATAEQGLSSIADESSTIEVEDSREAVEEITVTARKREEKLQEIPVAVTVVTERELAGGFNRDITDLEGYTPNLIIDPVRAGPLGAAISIRGISFQDVEKSFDPAIGVSIDDVYVGTSTTQLLINFDLASVEILRGPQGTLFGKNTMGGAIRARRTLPTMQWGAKGMITYGSYKRNDYRLVLNAPVIEDKLGIKGWFFSMNDDGYSWNTTKSERVGDLDYMSGGLSMLWEPIDSIDVLLTYEHIKDETATGPLVNMSQPASSQTKPGGDVVCTLYGQCATIDDYLNPVRETEQNFSDATSMSLNALTLEANFEIDEIGTITSITGWRGHEELVNQDFDAVSIDFFSTIREQTFDQVSEELRFTSEFSETIEFVTGLYFWWANYTLDQRSLFLLESLGVAPPGSSALQDTEQDTFAIAAFFQGDWHITDWLMLTAGVRYTWEQKEIDFALATDIPGLGVIPGDTFGGKEDWDEFTPMVSLTARATDDIMAYFQYSRGFKSGGFNGRAGSASAVGPYDPEIVDSLELGVKSDWLGKRMRVNLTGFYNMYDDKQEEFVVPAPPPLFQQTMVDNAASATTAGVELEWIVVPFEGFTLNQIFGYLFSEYDEFMVDSDGDGVPDTDFSDRDLRRAPKFQYSIFGTYARDIGPGAFTGMMSWRWTHDYETTAQNYSFGHVGPHYSLDLALTYDWLVWRDLEIRISGYGRNLTDETYIATALGVSSLSSFGAVSAPRTFGIEVGAKF